MSLNWNTEKVADFENVCFISATHDDPNHGVVIGDRLINPITNALIFGTCATGIGTITNENAAEFYARLRIHEMLNGPMLIRAIDPDTGERPTGSAAYITADEVRRHIGLYTNVSPLTRAKWLKNIETDMDFHMRVYCNSFEKLN